MVFWIRQCKRNREKGMDFKCVSRVYIKGFDIEYCLVFQCLEIEGEGDGDGGDIEVFVFIIF